MGTRLGYTDAQGAFVVHAMSSITPRQYFWELIDACYRKTLNIYGLQKSGKIMYTKERPVSMDFRMSMIFIRKVWLG